MKIVIQCAGSKNTQLPGSGFHTTDGRLVKFVADPISAPSSDPYAYVRPDDLSDDQHTWRERLLDYNKDVKSNPLHLFPAYRLYKNQVYERLVNEFGKNQVFILSAGWGLISSDFLTPDYDITFSNDKEKLYVRRRKSDHYADLCQLPDDGDTIVFMGGKEYLPLFLKLTKELTGKKIVFYNSYETPALGNGFYNEKFITTRNTNWHYSCAQALIDGIIKI
ncbi:MAG TPA: hypothetical protein VN456_11420 [Desulfosporosinus sp.]|nr:hypothetical protein [Desulfosporosinus sp.]